MNIVEGFLLIRNFLQKKHKKMKGMPKSVPFLFLWLCVSINLFAQNKENFILDAKVREIYTHSIKLEFEQAKVKLNSKEISGNAFRHLLANQADFLYIFIHEDKEKYESFLEAKASRLKALEKSDKISPFYLFAIAEINLQSAMLSLKFDDKLKAAFALKKAFSSIEKNKSNYPSFIINNKISGLLKAFAGAVPENYKWLSELLQFKGTVDEGLNDLLALEKALNTNEAYEFMLAEVIFYSVFISLNLSDLQPDYTSYYQRIDRLKMQSPLIDFCGASVAFKEKNIHKLEFYLNKEKGRSSFCFLDYLRGDLALMKEAQNADIYYNRYLTCYKGNALVKSAYQKIAWFHLINGNEKLYVDFMLLAKNEGNTTLDEDKMAFWDALKNYLPNKFLLQARILFDAGKYDEAHKVLMKNASNLNAGNDIFKHEYHYRLGRIYHALDSLDKALVFYEKTILERKKFNEYFSASAANYMGNIYSKKGKSKEAIKYYQITLEEKNHPYKNSLDAKAKAGIVRAKN